MMLLDEIKKEYPDFLHERAPFLLREYLQYEIDLLLNIGGKLRPIEIKSGMTYRNDYFKQLDWFSKVADVPLSKPTVIYGGEDTQPIGDHFLMSWRAVASLAD